MIDWPEEGCVNLVKEESFAIQASDIKGQD